MKKRWYICTVEKQKRSLKDLKHEKFFKNKFGVNKKKVVVLQSVSETKQKAKLL